MATTSHVLYVDDDDDNECNNDEGRYNIISWKNVDMETVLSDIFGGFISSKINHVRIYSIEISHTHAHTHAENIIYLIESNEAKGCILNLLHLFISFFFIFVGNVVVSVVKPI